MRDGCGIDLILWTTWQVLNYNHRRPVAQNQPAAAIQTDRGRPARIRMLAIRR